MTILSPKLILAVFLGGGLGSALRYGISVIFTHLRVGFSPIGTLVANVIACLIMAITFMIFADRFDQSIWIKAFILVGFCGGLSTFSTFSYETFTLLKSGNYAFAFLNVLLSLVMCLMVFYFFLKKV